MIQTYLPRVPGTVISGDNKKTNEIWFLKELDASETSKANPKGNIAVPDYSCHCHRHHHHHHIVPSASGPVPHALHKLMQ